MLSPLLFTLLTHDCVPKYSTNHIIKFVDDETVVGLMSNNEEANYRSEMSKLAQWCKNNNQTKEIIVDFRKRPLEHPPLTIA